MHARLALPGLAVLALVLAGCGSPGTDAAATQEPTVVASDVVTIDDAWVKAAESGMTAAFGKIVNSGDTDVTVVSVSSPAASMLEMHETVADETGEMVMQEKDGGFTIPAGDDLLLEPGANHIMLMGLVEPVKAGDEVTVTLTFSDDSTLDLTALAKDFAGAEETYTGGDEMDDSSTDMGDK